MTKYEEDKVILNKMMASRTVSRYKKFFTFYMRKYKF